MPVMEVRKVPVRMRQPVMPMRVCVPRRRRKARIGVVVVVVVMSMAVDVVQGFVGVLVLVLVEKEHGDTKEKERRCDNVSPEKRLSEEDEGKPRTEEWRAGERDLSPRRTQMLRGEHVGHDARAMRKDAEAERKKDVEPVRA